jgi:uncharacterized protein
MRNPSYSTRHPIIYAILLTLLILAVYVAGGAAAHFLNLSNNTFFLVANVILFILAMVFISAARGGRNVGLRPIKSWGVFWLAFIPPVVNLVYAGVNIANGVYKVPAITTIVVYFFLALLVGFNEEVYFRGLMLKPLSLRWVWRAAIITAILFGVSHSLNVLAGSDPVYVGLQIVYALALGFGFAAMAMASATIYPLILAHFLTDFFGFLSGGPGGTAPGMTEYAIAGVSIIAFIVYGIYLLRKVEKPKPGLIS